MLYKLFCIQAQTTLQKREENFGRNQYPQKGIYHNGDILFMPPISKKLVHYNMKNSSSSKNYDIVHVDNFLTKIYF